MRIVSKLVRAARLAPAIGRALYKGWRNPPAYPLWLQIEHTHRCNLKCVMCVHGNPHYEPAPDMPMPLFERILGQFNSPEARPGFDRLECLSLQGVGEPLLHPRALDMLALAKAKGLRTMFVSNMTLLSKAAAERLIEMEHDLIVASVDTVDPALMASIRRGVHFDIVDRIERNIALLQEIKARKGAKKPEIMVAAILMKSTVPGAPALVERMKTLGIEHIVFTHLYNDVPQSSSLADGIPVAEQALSTLPPDELHAIIASVKALDSPECLIEVPQESWEGAGQLQAKAVFTCLEMWTRPFVTSEGFVTPCCYAPYPWVLPMGRLDVHRFDEIWFGEGYQNIRRRHLTGMYPARCAACPQLRHVVAANDPRIRDACPEPVFLGDRACAFRPRKHGADGPPQ